MNNGAFRVDGPRKNALTGVGIALVFLAAVSAGCGGNGGGDGGGNSAVGGSAGGSSRGAAGAASGGGIAAGKHGGAFLDATIAPPKTFNPLTAKEVNIPAGYLFEGLVRLNPETLKIEPDLARSYTHSADGKTWTFKLRPNLRWADGQPLTADDVVFTLDVIYDPKVSTTLREVILVDGKPWAYKKLDNETVQITTPTPFAPFLFEAGFPILPRHSLESAWRTGRFNSTWGVDTPPQKVVGAGPFQMTQYASGESVKFHRNPNYWRSGSNGKPLPYLEGGVVQDVPDLNSLLLRFKSKELDFTSVRPGDWQSVQQGASSGGYRALDLGPDWGITYLSFNLNPRATSVPAYKRAWFAQKAFRQAISYGINRKSIIDTVYRGLARPLWGPISEADKTFYDPKVTQYPYNPQKAQQLLASIGLSKKNSDGVLVDAAGHPVEFTLMTNAGNDVRESMCSAIASDLKKIGVKVDVTPTDFNNLVTRLMSTYDWDANLLGFTGGPEPNGWKSVWTTPGINHFWNPQQKIPATPWEAEIDGIFSKAAQTLDQNQRKKLYNRWQEIASDQLPMIFLVTPDALVAVQDRLKNTRPTALGIRWNSYEWSE